jgi:hypothetical protein
MRRLSLSSQKRRCHFNRFGRRRWQTIGWIIVRWRTELRIPARKASIYIFDRYRSICRVFHDGHLSSAEPFALLYRPCQENKHQKVYTYWVYKIDMSIKLHANRYLIDIAHAIFLTVGIEVRIATKFNLKKHLNRRNNTTNPSLLCVGSG